MNTLYRHSLWILLLALAACSSSPTSIHDAARKGDLEAVQKFIDQDPKSVMSTGGSNVQTPLHVAKTAAIVELLLSKGADINATDRNTYTPLHTAQSAEAAEALIKHGADVFRETGDHVTPIYTCQTPEVISVLIAHGARVNDSLPNQPFKTPLWFAVNNGRLDMVKALLDLGASPRVTDSYGNTYLHNAAGDNKTEIAELLVKGGADVNATNQYGITPLLSAVMSNAQKTAELLLENKADPSRSIASNITMMSFNATQSSNKDISGKNALALAETDAMKQLLQKYGAK